MWRMEPTTGARGEWLACRKELPNRTRNAIRESRLNLFRLQSLQGRHEFSLSCFPRICALELCQVESVEIIVSGPHLLDLVLGRVLKPREVERRHITNEIREHRTIVRDVVRYYGRCCYN